MHVGDAAEADTMRLKTEHCIECPIVQAVVVMSMEGVLDLHRLGQHIDFPEAVWMARGCLMRDEDIDLPAAEVEPVAVEDR